MPAPLSDLIDLLDLEKIEENLFRGNSPNEGWQRVYGGQVLGQALVAASRTVEDSERLAHSLHAYFIRPGDLETPLVYKVDRIRDGRSFTTRRVYAIQKGRPIFILSVSFHIAEPGLEHQVAMPRVPAPLDCPDAADLRQRFADDIPDARKNDDLDRRPLEIRYIDPVNEWNPQPAAPQQSVWVRTTGPMPDDLRLQQCVLAYASDMTLIDTSIRPHAIAFDNPDFQVASLDHAMWFHRPFRMDEWLLYTQDSPATTGARGFNRGRVFREDGSLVVTASQEGLIRLRSLARPAAAPSAQ